MGVLEILTAVDEALLRDAGGYLFHETQRAHLPAIREEGLRPLSFGQSFVRDDGSISSPDEARDEILAELEDEALDEDWADAEVQSRADERLHDEHPPADFRPRMYVSLTEPRTLNYGEVLLRFSRALATPTRAADVDWYVCEVVPACAIEMFDGGVWRRLG